MREELHCACCVAATFHRLDEHGTWVCDSCGTSRPPETSSEPTPAEVPSMPHEPGNPSEDGSETYSERLPGAQTYSEHETYSEQQREGLSGEGLRAWDRRDDFAAWVCERAGLRFEKGEQEVVVGGTRL